MAEESALMAGTVTSSYVFNSIDIQAAKEAAKTSVLEGACDLAKSIQK